MALNNQEYKQGYNRNYHHKNRIKIMAYQKEYYKKTQALKHAGVCTQCRKSPARPDRRLCTLCAWKAIAFQRGTTIEVLDRIYDRQDGKCVLSGIPLVKGVNASPDHIVHKMHGGTSEESNLRLLDWKINQARNTLTDQEFIEMCQCVVKYCVNT